MTPLGSSILIASADRLFAEAAARYLQRGSGVRAITENDGVRALMAVARFQPSAVLVLGNLARLPAEAFARRVRTRWPSMTIVVLGSPEVPGALPLDADGADVVAALASSPSTGEPSHDPARSEEVAALQRLTRRERGVLVLLGQGLEFEEIAGRLSISEHTVRTHLQNLYRKLDLHSRLEIVRLVARHGLLQAPEGEDG